MGIETLNEDLELNIPMFDDDMDIIAKLDDEPNAVGGLTAAELKAEFDRPGKTIQEYLNKTLIPSLIGTVAEESVRAQNEYIRVTNENQRVANENGRVEEEERRNTAELERIENEDSRGDNETKRVQAETARAAAEAQRESAEQAREDKTSGIVAQATEQANEAKNQADRAEEQAKKAGDEADRAAEQANLARQVKSMQAEATTLSAGSEATAKVEEENGDLVLRVGIPVGRDGKDGLQGPVGPAGADGQDGNTPYIGANGNWWIGEEDTGVSAKGSAFESSAPDWNQNDPEQPDYIKGRTHWLDSDGYHPIAGRYLPDSVPWVENYATDILSCEVLLDDNGEAKLDVRPEIFEGGKYVVSWNGAEFNCEARAFEENGAYIGMAIGPGDPFTIILVTEEMVETVGSSFLVRGSLDYARAVVDLRISKRGIYYRKLQKELLPDDVPFVYATKQSLTEEQKAQARDNIGVENVLESVGGDTLTWDGNTEGLVSVLDVYYKVPDVVITAEDIGSLLEAGNNLDDTKVKLSTGEFMSGGFLAAPGFIAVGEVCFIISEEAVGIDFDGLYFQEAGIYFVYLAEEGAEPVFASSLTIPGYTGFVKKKIKEEYIPENVPQVQTAAVGQTIVVSEVDENGKPTKWEARDAGGGGGTTTQMVSTTVTVGTETVVLDDTAPEQEVLLAWDAPEARTVPAFTNYYIPRSNISYPRTFNANAYTQFASNSAAHGNADTFVAGHTYFQALRYEMDGESFAMLHGFGDFIADIESGSAGATADGSVKLTGRGWVYTTTTPRAVGQFSTRFNKDGSGTGTVRYLYCIDVTALVESGVIESTSVAYLAELFGGLELVPGQNFEGANYGSSMKLTITRGSESIEVDGGTEKTTVIGGDVLYTDVGKVTFVLKVPKTESTNGASGSGGCDWSGKKWVAFGDSLTAEFINADKKYYRHIEGKTGINVVVMGAGGTGYAKNYGGGTSYGERMTNCPSDADVITIFGSINDWNTLNTGGVQIGSPSDSLDAGTYSGYVNNCIDVAIDKAPYAQIALVSPMFYRGIALNLQESIAAALKAVAEYRRIKFLDLYHDSGFRIENDTFAQAYTTDYSATDETFGHPNNLAHERLIAPEFMELLRRMLLS